MTTTGDATDDPNWLSGMVDDCEWHAGYNPGAGSVARDATELPLSGWYVSINGHETVHFETPYPAIGTDGCHSELSHLVADEVRRRPALRHVKHLKGVIDGCGVEACRVPGDTDTEFWAISVSGGALIRTRIPATRDQSARDVYALLAPYVSRGRGG